MSRERIVDYRYCKEIPENYEPQMVGVEHSVQSLEHEMVITFNDAEDMAGISY